MITAGYSVAALALLCTAGLAIWSHTHAGQHNRFMHDGPVMIMYGLGAWLLLPLGWIGSVGYFMAVVACNLWFVVRVCPHCPYHDRADRPSLYCVLASRLTDKGDPQLFASQFRSSTGLLALNWILPVIGGIIALRRSHEWTYCLTLLTAFGLIAFYLVPIASRPSCVRCVNKEACPYGKRVKGTKLSGS
jgi:hypothetical protein